MSSNLIPNGKSANDIVDNAYTITLLIEAKLSNPNGDPDRDNAPRVDPITQRGLISDVCIKRKIRDYLAAEYGQALHVANGSILNNNVAEVTESLGISVHRETKAAKAGKAKAKVEKAKAAGSGEMDRAFAFEEADDGVLGVLFWGFWDGRPFAPT